MTERIDPFISCEREERSLADAVSRALQRRGFTVVTDIDTGALVGLGVAGCDPIRAAARQYLLAPEHREAA